MLLKLLCEVFLFFMCVSCVWFRMLVNGMFLFGVLLCRCMWLLVKVNCLVLVFWNVLWLLVVCSSCFIVLLVVCVMVGISELVIIELLDSGFGGRVLLLIIIWICFIVMFRLCVIICVSMV